MSATPSLAFPPVLIPPPAQLRDLLIAPPEAPGTVSVVEFDSIARHDLSGRVRLAAVVGEGLKLTVRVRPTETAFVYTAALRSFNTRARLWTRRCRWTERGVGASSGGSSFDLVSSCAFAVGSKG